MKNYESRIKLLIPLFLILIALFSPSSTSYAADPCSNDPNSDLFKKFGPCPGGLTEIEAVVSNVISVVVGLGFIALLVLVLWSGFKFITSGGEPKALQSARAVFTWAILGIFFMAIAWLVLLLIENFTGIKVTTFNITTLCGGIDLPFCQPNKP